jgi:hypothetical protein
MSAFVNCFNFWCSVREKSEKKDKIKYKTMKETPPAEKTEKKALEIMIPRKDILYDIEI